MAADALGSARQRALRSDAKRSRKALLQSALKLFASEGPDVPLHRIAQDAGVGVATLYRSFPSRAWLATAVIRHVLDVNRRFLEKLPVTGESFFEVIDYAFDNSLQTVEWVALIMDPETAEAAAEIAEELNRNIEPFLRAAQQEGLVRADLEPSDLRMLIRMSHGALGPKGYRGLSDAKRARRLLKDAIQITDAPPLPPREPVEPRL